MYCKKCGAQCRDGAAYCRNCGAPLYSGGMDPYDDDYQQMEGYSGDWDKKGSAGVIMVSFVTVLLVGAIGLFAFTAMRSGKQHDTARIVAETTKTEHKKAAVKTTEDDSATPQAKTQATTEMSSQTATQMTAQSTTQSTASATTQASAKGTVGTGTAGTGIAGSGTAAPKKADTGDKKKASSYGDHKNVTEHKSTTREASQDTAKSDTKAAAQDTAKEATEAAAQDTAKADKEDKEKESTETKESTSDSDKETKDTGTKYDKYDENKDGWIIKDSDSVLIEEADMEDDDWEKEYCHIVRDEIYARAGRGFDDSEVQKYFDAKSWYTKKYDPDTFDKSQPGLTETAKANLETIQEYEEEKGWQ